ncbi:hypothetical protein CkaCkLH20_09475 [Colletotrichum karsti]|uniref:Uncharacterized protein n=1 Tax=Colletotrichum karsti TaxID=1095194 RepID=A0A9P6I6M9_9PEZI|nr:uncharacterized protein CkaCkLH20_09475 [Colletotrichum karsti]KAF9872965.1 hypothetical protein CkaCkLH20_09475 [Colletotrichum karsti]
MSAIRSSSSALLLIGGVATLPGAASVRSHFPQRSSASTDAELGYMQQPLGPASSQRSVTTSTKSVKSTTAASSKASLGWQGQAL